MIFQNSRIIHIMIGNRKLEQKIEKELGKIKKNFNARI